MEQNETSKRFLTVQQYATEMGLSRSTVYRHIEQGKLETEDIDGVQHVVLDLSSSEPELPPYVSEMVQHLKTENEHLRQQVEKLQTELLESRQRSDSIVQQMQQDSESARERSDTIILQLTQQLDQQTKLIEDMRQKDNKRGFFKRLLGKEKK
jgi:excisionase family DNA binding protein